MTIIEPQEIINPDISHGSNRPLMENVTDTTATSNNWSGVVMQGAGQFDLVNERWDVPSVNGIGGSGTTYSSLWVGIDGYNNNPTLVQAEPHRAHCLHQGECH